jgi:hypothetical protein
MEKRTLPSKEAISNLDAHPSAQAFLLLGDRTT